MKQFPSCAPPKPLLVFEGGTASVLNYNLPAATAFRVKRYIPISIPASYFNTEAARRPPDTPGRALGRSPKVRPKGVRQSTKHLVQGRVLYEIWAEERPIPEPEEPVTKRKALTERVVLPPELREMAITYPSLNPLLVFEREVREKASELARQTYSAATRQEFEIMPAAAASATAQVSTLQEPEVSITSDIFHGLTMQDVKYQFALGRLPLFTASFYGLARASFYEEPRQAAPTLVLIEEYEVASYLGDYGAGRTVKTFSLLPGERTVISIKTYRTETQTRSKTENILDSFSQESADEFESIVNDESSSTDMAKTAEGRGFTSTESWGQSGSVGAKGGLNLGIVSIGASAGVNLSHSDTDVNTSSFNSERANTASSLHKAMDRHVAQSSAARKVEVNVESQSSVTTTAGEETSTTRELENINRSRVLNFVFRQLNQEYLTITYLKDVQLGFTQGYPGDGEVARPDNFRGLLNSHLKAGRVDEVLMGILDQLNNIYDHTGQRVSFLVREEEEIADFGGRGEVHTYFRKDPRLEQEYAGKKVKGVIIDVARRILPTDALVVEALLGQGEALDCYNQRLQEAAADRADLENAAREQAIRIIDGIKGAAEKANLYKKVFGADPQTVIRGGEE